MQGMYLAIIQTRKEILETNFLVQKERIIIDLILFLYINFNYNFICLSFDYKLFIK